MSIRLSVLSLMPMLMLMQACDGTSFGQRLSESFDSQAGEISPAAAQSDSTDGDSELSVTAAKTSEPDKRVDSDKAKASESEAETQTASAEQATAVAANERPDPRPVPERARPYRIIIRLSAADPAAPAEGVTDALRRAGIGFEVETIEKVPVSELNQSSNPQTKPAP